MLVAGPLLAQSTDVMIKAFGDNFRRALDVPTKIEILKDAYELGGKEMGPLFAEVIDSFITDPSVILNDFEGIQLASTAIRLIGMIGYSDASYKLWQLFDAVDISGIRVDILSVLGQIAKEDSEVIDLVNRWLQNQNIIKSSGKPVDQPVIEECIAALGKLGDKDSFPVIFSTKVLGYSKSISEKAITALESIEGDFKDNVIFVIQNNSISEKYEALKFAISYEKLTAEAKGEISIVALREGIDTIASDQTEKNIIRELRSQAAGILANLKWSQATDLAMENFDLTVQEYNRGTTDITYLIVAINCLGAMATHEAAVRLTLYLELLNQYVENGQKVDDQVVLTVIKNLGILGDEAAFGPLLYIKYLDYSNTIKRAAEEARKNLQ